MWVAVPILASYRSGEVPRIHPFYALSRTEYHHFGTLVRLPEEKRLSGECRFFDPQQSVPSSAKQKNSRVSLAQNAEARKNSQTAILSRRHAEKRLLALVLLCCFCGFALPHLGKGIDETLSVCLGINRRFELQGDCGFARMIGGYNDFFFVNADR